MQWTDDAIILTTAKFSENALRVTVLSKERGLASGLARAGKSSKKRGLYQPGNLAHITWKGRLAEHLGSFTAELLTSYSAPLMHDADALIALSSAISLSAITLPEAHPEPEIYEQLHQLLPKLQHPEHWAADYIRYELALLNSCGFPLDLSCCTATGTTKELIYVSPKSGRAVSREAGLPYASKLLPLPAFIVNNTTEKISNAEFKQGLTLTGYFLNHFAEEIRHQPLPAVRTQLLARVNQSLEVMS